MRTRAKSTVKIARRLHRLQGRRPRQPSGAMPGGRPVCRMAVRLRGHQSVVVAPAGALATEGLRLIVLAVSRITGR